MPTVRKRLKDDELELIEDLMALVIAGQDHLRRAIVQVQYTDTEIMPHLVGLAEVILRMKKHMLDWKPILLGDLPYTPRIERDCAVRAVNEALKGIEIAFKNISDVKSLLEAQNQLQDAQQTKETGCSINKGAPGK